MNSDSVEGREINDILYSFRDAESLTTAEAKADLLALLEAEAVEYNTITEEFGGQTVGTVKAIPLSKVRELFGG